MRRGEIHTQERFVVECAKDGCPHTFEGRWGEPRAAYLRAMREYGWTRLPGPDGLWACAIHAGAKVHP